MKVSIYWPGKRVSKKLETITLVSGGEISAKHDGFGLVVRRKGFNIVYAICGVFIKITGKDPKNLSIVNVNGNGVFHTTKFVSFFKMVIEPNKCYLICHNSLLPRNDM